MTNERYNPWTNLRSCRRAALRIVRWGFSGTQTCLCPVAGNTEFLKSLFYHKPTMLFPQNCIRLPLNCLPRTGEQHVWWGGKDSRLLFVKYPLRISGTLPANVTDLLCSLIFFSSRFSEWWL
jgi:hypothetical protein